MATEIPPPEAERFVAATEQLKKLVLRLEALRMRHARLEQAFRDAAEAANPCTTRSKLKRLQRLDALLERVEQRRDAALAATAAFVTSLGKQS